VSPPPSAESSARAPIDSNCPATISIFPRVIPADGASNRPPIITVLPASDTDPAVASANPSTSTVPSALFKSNCRADILAWAATVMSPPPIQRTIPLARTSAPMTSGWFPRFRKVTVDNGDGCLIKTIRPARQSIESDSSKAPLSTCNSILPPG
jgi:hypothetical protein